VYRRTFPPAPWMAAIVAGAALLAPANAALAAAKPAAEIKQIIAPRQAGPWSITGWGKGGDPSHCVAERRPTAAPGAGAAVQFALVRMPDMYRIVLGSDEWALAPGSVIPIELNAAPVFRSEANAIVTSPKAMIIDLGGNVRFMQRLATAPILEVKTAQAVHRLRLDGFGAAISEADSCLAAIKPGSNPASAPGMASRFPAAPEESRVTNGGLIEERTFLTVRNAKGSYRLEALLVRPAAASGRLPIALITHGKNLTPLENESVHADWMAPQARDFAARGWLAVVVMRRGYGASDGVPGISLGGAYMHCGSADLVRGFEVEADDLAGALQAVSARPDADASRVLAMGQSFGGGTVLAFAARRPAGLVGVINVSGGVRRSDAGGVCDYNALIAAMDSFGNRTRVPTLWLYSENDTLFPPEIVNRMHDVYVVAGGRAQLKMFPPVGKEGHALFADVTARSRWLPAVDGFLLANRLPNANVARLDEVRRAPGLAPFKREFIEQYLAMPLPKVLAVSPNGTVSWFIHTSGLDAARSGALGSCREKAGRECTILMENDDLVRPMVTSANSPSITAR
jgi:dienelactone hydrolase